MESLKTQSSGEIYLMPLCVIAVIENLLMCLLICWYRKFRTATNVFIVGLSITNVLFAGVLLPIHCFHQNTDVYSFLTLIIILIYTCNLTAVTFERFIAISKPLHYNIYINKRTAVRVTTGCYIVPTVYCLLPLAWNSQKKAVAHKIYLITTLIVFLITPLVFILAVYAKVYHETHIFYRKHRKLIVSRKISKSQLWEEAKFFCCMYQHNIRDECYFPPCSTSSSLASSSYSCKDAMNSSKISDEVEKASINVYESKSVEQEDARDNQAETYTQTKSRKKSEITSIPVHSHNSHALTLSSAHNHNSYEAISNSVHSHNLNEVTWNTAHVHNSHEVTSSSANSHKTPQEVSACLHSGQLHKQNNLGAMKKREIFSNFQKSPISIQTKMTPANMTKFPRINTNESLERSTTNKAERMTHQNSQILNHNKEETAQINNTTVMEKKKLLSQNEDRNREYFLSKKRYPMKTSISVDEGKQLLMEDQSNISAHRSRKRSDSVLFNNPQKINIPFRVRLRRNFLSNRTLCSRRLHSKAKQKLVELKASLAFAMVSLTYMFTWLPVAYMSFLQVIEKPNYIPQWLELTSIYAIGLNAMIDPLVYGFCLKQFRSTIKSIIRKKKSLST